MEFLDHIALTIVLSAVLLLVAFVVVAPILSLDDSDPGDEPAQERIERPWSERLRDAAWWVIPAFAIATLLVFILPFRGAMVIGMLAVLNVSGTATMLAELQPGARSARVFKALAILQIPVGTLIFLAQGV